MTKTDNAELVGVHKFEAAGLGKAPFRFIGMSENVIKYPDGSSKAGGCCDYCLTGIRDEFHIKSADGKVSKVGCNCIEKVGDKGLYQAFKSSPVYRAHVRAKTTAKNAAVLAELKATMEARKADFQKMAHPMGFTDRKTGAALTYWDQVEWMFNACGAAGRARLLNQLKKI